MNAPILAFLGLGGGELILILLAIVIMGLIVIVLAVAAYFLVRSLSNQPSQPTPAANAPPNQAMMKNGKQVAEHANLAGSLFHDVNLTGADFDNVNLSNARFHNVNLSNVSVTAAQMGGAALRHIGPPPDLDGKQARQRPVRFEEMMLCDSVFRRVDMSNVRLTECDLTGMTIDGMPVEELIAAYRKQHSDRPEIF